MEAWFLSDVIARMRRRFGTRRRFRHVRVIRDLPPEEQLSRFLTRFLPISPVRSTLVYWTPELRRAREKNGTFLGRRNVDGTPVFVEVDRSLEFPADRLVLLASPDAAAVDALVEELLDSHPQRTAPRFIYSSDGSEMIDLRPTPWEELILPDDLVLDIRSSVDHFLHGRAFFEKQGIPYRRGLLFSGPPGNGKTAILRALITEHAELPFAIFEGADRGAQNTDLNGFLDRRSLPEDLVRALVFEDLDQLLTKSSISLSHFLNRLDGLKELGGCLIIATTNHPERLDPALIDRPSRFDRVFEVCRPNDSLRGRFLARRLQTWNLPEQPLPAYIAATEGFSMAQLQEVFISAAALAFAAACPDVKQPHFETALERVAAQRNRTARNAPWTDASSRLGFRSRRSSHVESD